MLQHLAAAKQFRHSWVATLLIGLATSAGEYSMAQAATEQRRPGGYYQDDGPAGDIPRDLDHIPDATPRAEAINPRTTHPYEVFGRLYTPRNKIEPFRQRGIASWYGKKFHGQKTSSGEPYDMFAMTAAHPELPIPSYVRVSNPATGRAVIVRVNDRGPFHAERIIDLSYTAALKLGYIGVGSTAVDIEQIVPDGVDTLPPTAPAGDELGELIARLERQAATSAAQASGTYLQLGAFANPDNADNLRLHLERELEWLTEGIRVFAARLPNGNPIHRLQAGPFASRAAAEKAAERIRVEMGARPALVTR